LKEKMGLKFLMHWILKRGRRRMGEGDGKGKERRCGTSPVRARSDGTGAIEVLSLMLTALTSP
jgi:hypothetical protein